MGKGRHGHWHRGSSRGPCLFIQDQQELMETQVGEPIIYALPHLPARLPTSLYSCFPPVIPTQNRCSVHDQFPLSQADWGIQDPV